MKNIPNKIYLQIGNEDVSEDFNELYKTEISWATDQLNKSDLEFYSKDEIIKAIIYGYRSRNKEIALSKTIGKWKQK